MRVKTPVIPYWATAQSYTDYLGSTGNLTPFPFEFSLEDYGKYFWGVASWRLHGSFTYQLPDVPGVSWAAPVTESFTVDLDEWLLGSLEVENARVLNSGYRFEGLHTGTQQFYADLVWFRQFELNASPKILWNGNHGEEAGSAKPGFMLYVTFTALSDMYLRTLRTDVPVSLGVGEVASQVSDLTFRGETIDWFTAEHSVPDAGSSRIIDFTATLEPLSYFEFRDENGNNPVWDAGTGTQLIDPRTT